MRNKLQLSLFLALLLIGAQGKFTSVIAAPTVEFSYSGTCVGSTTTFTVNAAVTNVSAVTDWLWSFGDGTFSTIQNPTNTYAGPGTFPVRLWIKDTNGDTVSIVHNVIIQALPVSFFSYATPNCSNNFVQFTDLSTTANGFIDRWIWNYGDGSPDEVIVFPSDPNPKHIFPTTGTFNVTLTVMNTDLCKNQFSTLVTVSAKPTANFYFAGECEDQEVTFTDASSANGGGNIVSRVWDFTDPLSGIDQTSNLENPVHIFQNAGTYLVKLIITNYNNCTDTISKNVLINPHPPLDFTFTTSCQNTPVSFAPDAIITNIPSIATWLWDFGDGNISYSKNISHTYTTPGTYTVTLKITDLKGCENVVSHSIVIDPLPVANFNLTLSNCAGTKVVILDQSIATVGFINQWNWDFGDGNSITVNRPTNPDVSHIYTTPGIYNITLTTVANNGCSKSVIKQVTIRPNLLANFDFTTACVGSAVNFTDLTQLNGAGSIVQWQWDFDDAGSGVPNNSSLQNPDHTFTTAGNHQVQLVVTPVNGCNDTISRTILVNSPPPVNFNSANNCLNSTVSFTPDASTMNLASISSWYWEFGTGVTSTFQNPSYIYASSGTFNVKLTVVDIAGCSNTVMKPLTINPQPVVNFSYLQPACTKSLVQFSNLSSATAGFIVRSEWNFDDGTLQSVSSLLPVSHTYTSSGTYNVTLTVITSDSCKKSIILPVVIQPVPLANFSFQNTCINSPVQFNNLSQAGSGGITSSSWNFGDLASGTNNHASSTNPVHSFSTAGTFQVALIVSNSGGCLDTIVKPLLVHALPAVDFSFSTGCVNSATQFVSSTFVNVVSITSIQWSFGDGTSSTDVDPVHTYIAPGSYNITLTITDINGCTNTKTHTLIILESPLASFQVLAQTCSNHALLFTNYSSTPAGNIISYFWEFGDGKDTLILAPADGNVSHSYTGTGNFTASLTVHSSLGCEAKTQRPVNVSASPLAQFGYSNSCETAVVGFSDLSLANSGTAIVKWSWNFGDPATGPNNSSNQKNPFHTYSTPGTYIVQLIVENVTGCTSTVTKIVTVKSKPTVDFSWASSCLGSPTTFAMDATVTNIAAIASYEWNFGDGSAHNTTQKNPVHTYSVTGDFTATLSITNTDGCTNQVTHTVTIVPNPTAIFTFISACAGTSVQFADQSFTSGTSPITAWHWDFGVNTAVNDTSDLQNPEWNYPVKGYYDVTLSVTSQNGCKDVATHSLQVYGNPTADFSYTASACENGTVNFINNSYSQQASIVASQWEFETDNFSNQQNPSYVFYSTDSCYDVRLTVKDIRGCVNTVVKSVCVPADYDITFLTSGTCIKDSTYFTPQLVAPASGTLISFKWNFGDMSSGIKNTSTKKTPSHYFAQPGTYTVSLEATDANNCTKTIYKNVTINPLPLPSFTYTKGICDSTITFNESSSGNGSNISKWIWNFGDGVSTTILPPNSPDLSHHYRSPGTYDVSLTVYNDNGCSGNIIEKSVQVNPCLSASIELVDQQVCQNNIVAFANNSFSSLSANIWYWDFGDGTHATFDTYSTQVNHTYKTPGAYTVKMILSTFVNLRKVTDTAHLIVNVNPSPRPDFTFKIDCNEKRAEFTDMTSGSGIKIVDYNWTFGEPASAPRDSSSLKDPVHTYRTPGTYEVTLVAKNLIGCSDSVQKLLVINGLPVANFSSVLSCAGFPTTFSDLSINSGTPITSWNWTFSDNISVIGGKDVQNPEFVFKKPGDYFVNLKITDANGCHDSIGRYVSTWDVPESNFTYTENFDQVQGQLQFINSSVDATKYHWTFGNGEISYAEKPIELYKDEGKFNITLIAYNDKGCSDTLSMPYNFMVKGLFIPNAFSPTNPKTEVQLLKPVGINLQEYLIEVFDRWGNLVWWSDKIDSMGCPTEGWDGTYKGELLQEGVYPWRASGIFKDGSIWQAENVGNSDHLPKSRVGTSTMMR